MVPDNIVEASFSSTVTKFKKTVKEYRFKNETAENLKSSAKNLSSFLKNEVVDPWSISGNDNVQHSSNISVSSSSSDYWISTNNYENNGVTSGWFESYLRYIGYDKTRTKLERGVTNFTFVNKSAVHLKSSPGNLSSFLKKEEINPWSISADSIQVIKEGNVIYEYVGQEKYNSANLLGVLVLSIVFGIVLNGLGDKGKAITDLFTCLFQLFLKIVEIVMWFSPIGVTSIIASKLVEMDDIMGTMKNIGLYVITVLVASILFGLFVIPGIYVILLRRNPFRLLRFIAEPLVIVLGIASRWVIT
ncbi:excitatory amino acid transporter 3-like [Dendronephthya gigantea]|uniref:excitatory amino acid transporter 3-like n=1 Tax=Dendronephthya gigantea TaxID=151771 RepID=UPI00106B46FA|nr:excitatory amino acid transporter 3-like [Dendronephthya gigantea]